MLLLFDRAEYKTLLIKKGPDREDTHRNSNSRGTC